MAEIPYNKLKKKWYAKLKKEGFQDIEQDEYNLKRWSNEFTRPNHNVDNKKYDARPKKVRQKSDTFEWKRDYYYYAEHFLNNYKFKSERERVIWSYHVNGISMRGIVDLLRKIKIKVSKSTICNIVKKLKKTMKETYLKSELM